MTAREVIGELRRLHPAEGGEWAFFVEQFGIDAYAIRLWGASGPHPYRRVAYEVKVSRSDFLGELRRPEKRAAALAVSHQFYFAMPAELAARCAADVLLRAPECGLIAVHDGGVRVAGGRKSPFVGCGPSARAVCVRHAPLRRCGGFTDWQIISLIRKADREPGLDDALHQRDLEHERLVAERRRLREASRRAAAAEEQLVRLAMPLVEPGSEWSDGRGGRATVGRIVDVAWWDAGHRRVVVDVDGETKTLTVAELLLGWAPPDRWVAAPARPRRAHDVRF